jgi:type I restriction enzyme M protein
MSRPAAGYNFTSSGLRQKVDVWFDILWAGGVNNPMDAIEQISYLLFLRLLWEKDELLAALGPSHSGVFRGDWARRGWGNFVTLTGDQLFDALRDAIENLHNLPGLSATGRLLFDRATLKIYDRPTLRALIQGIHEIDLSTHAGVDVKGDMYEYLLSRLSVAGRNGQFRTPRHIVNLIVDLVDPKPDERICDPACGTAGFLVAAFQHILREATPVATLREGVVDGGDLSPAQWKFLDEDAFTGFDNDANMVKIAIMNLYLHQLERADIRFMNPLTTTLGAGYPGELFEVVLANPPFSGSIQQEAILADIHLSTTATELLFVKWFVDHLEPGGRAGVIVPSGVLSGQSRVARRVRDVLVSECQLQAVVNLPPGVFRPYSGTATAALVFEKRPPTGDVWFYDLTGDGFTLDDRRLPTDRNDIPDLLERWPKRSEGPNSFSIPLDRIRHEGSLDIGRYRTYRGGSAERVDPFQLIAEIRSGQREIGDLLDSIEGDLKQ